MSWLQTFDDSFWLTIAASSFACIGLIIRYFFKSKCKKCSCCGIIVERDIEAEIEEERIELDGRSGHSFPSENLDSSRNMSPKSINDEKSNSLNPV